MATKGTVRNERWEDKELLRYLAWIRSLYPTACEVDLDEVVDEVVDGAVDTDVAIDATVDVAISLQY